MRLLKSFLLIAFTVIIASCSEEPRQAPSNLAAKYDGQVVLYATSWCSYCQKMREYFKRQNIEYLEYDVEENAVGRAEFDEIGANGIPVVLVKGHIVEGYDTKAIFKLIREK